MVSQRRHGSNNSTLLAATRRACRNKNARCLGCQCRFEQLSKAGLTVFTPVGARPPLTSGRVPESLPLRREVAVTSRNAEEEGIVFLQDFCVGDWNIGFGRGVHFREDFLGKRLCNLVDIGLDTSLLETFLLGLGQFCDMAIHGILRSSTRMVSRGK